MPPPPAGLWDLPTEALKTLPGYSPDVEKNRAEARKIMEKLVRVPARGCRSRYRRAVSCITGIPPFS
jgi:hypothetical protein